MLGKRIGMIANTIFDELHGMIFGQNIAIPNFYDELSITYTKINRDTFWFIDRSLHKFCDDEVFDIKDDRFVCLEGHVDNKVDLISKSKNKNWSDILYADVVNNNLSELRGGFCGIVCDGENKYIFVDQVGNKTLYYYTHENVMIVSTKLFFITEVLKHAQIKCAIDEDAVKYLLTLGFMPDNSTVCKDIKRVCPGECIVISDNGKLDVIRYFMPDNSHIDSTMKLNDALEGVDYYFRQAIKREFEKDIEYGFRHLVDLSGGLDSRMVSVVAHDMGYIEQTNIAYSQSNSLDFNISQRIACDMKHMYIFMPLDYFKWFLDVDSNTKLLNAAVQYSGATGACHLLRSINSIEYGIEHTGMVGDAILGTFYNEKYYNFDRPNGKENAYSCRLNFDVPVEILERFANREQYSIYARGLMGAQSSYMLRQNFFETASPFLDVDFLNFILTVPFEFRKKHRLYLAWIEKGYPFANKYGWEKWHGVKPLNRNRMIKKRVVQVGYDMLSMAEKFSPHKIHTGMNPMDYWYSKDIDVRKNLIRYYEESLKMICDCVPDNLLSAIREMFENGNVGEKEQALTAISAIKMLI